MKKIIFLVTLSIALNGYVALAQDTTVPIHPWYVTFYKMTPNSVTLYWWTGAKYNGIDLAGYDISQDGMLLASIPHKGDFYSHEYNVNNLTEGITYEFSVRTYDVAGNYSDWVTIAVTPILDSEQPTAPTNLTASNITSDSVHLEWTAPTDNVAVDGIIIYIDGIHYTYYVGDELVDLIINDLEANTTYTFSLKARDTSITQNESEFSNSTTITTREDNCNSINYDTTYEYIDYVGIGEISNTTASDDGYGDYKSMVANLSRGINTIELSAGFTNSIYAEGFGVWIDFNQDGIFEASEHVVSGAVQNEDKYSYTFMIPSTTKLGDTRMRIAMKWNGVPEACESGLSYGEVEDYTVNIIEPQSKSTSLRRIAVGETKKGMPIKVYPNPADHYIQVNLPDKNTASYIINDVSGRITRSGAIQNNKVGLESLESGTYFISIRNGKEKVTKQFVKK